MGKIKWKRQLSLGRCATSESIIAIKSALSATQAFGVIEKGKIDREIRLPTNSSSSKSLTNCVFPPPGLPGSPPARFPNRFVSKATRRKPKSFQSLFILGYINFSSKLAVLIGCIHFLVQTLTD